MVTGSSTWLRCDFTPLDNVVASDTRPLGEGGYSHGEGLLPSVFAGAIKAHVLRHSKASKQETLDSFCDFRAVGPFFRFNGKLAVPMPRTVTASPGGGHSWTAVDIEGEDKCVLSDLETSLCNAGRENRYEPVLIELDELLKPARLKELPADRRVWPFRQATESFNARSTKEPPEAGLLFARTVIEPPRPGRTGDGVLFQGYTVFVPKAFAGLLPASSVVRLGADGRQAVLEVCQDSAIGAGSGIRPLAPEVLARIRENDFCTLTLVGASIFADGWKPRLDGVELVAAAVGPPVAVSGWDVKRPKPVQRAVPPGSVYIIRLTDESPDPEQWHLTGPPEGGERAFDEVGGMVVGSWPPDEQ